jgi:ABC-type nitrate/sulfonate/bicarbonate transport system substrate-binding protein
MRTMSTDHPLRLGVFTTASVVALARGLGLFEANGIEVDVEEVKGSGAQMRGLRVGDLDLVHTSPDNVMKARLDGDDVVVVFVLDTGLPQLLVGRAGIGEWDDVRGGVVGVDDPASGFAFVVYELLGANGVSVDECEITSIGSSRQRLDALRDGTIDVGLLSAAMSGRIDESGLHVLASAADAVPWYPGVAVATSRRVIDERGDDLRGYVTALFDAAGWASDPANADAACDLVAAGMDLHADEAAAVLRREAAARTELLPDASAAADAVSKVAELRERYTGVRVDGSFDSRWMRELDERAGR